MKTFNGLKIKLYKLNQYGILLIITTYIFTYYSRLVLSNISTNVSYINFLILLLSVITFYQIKVDEFSRIRFPLFFLVMLTLIISSIAFSQYKDLIRIVNFVLLPLAFLLPQNLNYLKRLINVRVIIYYYNAVIYLIVAFGVIDYLLSGALQFYVLKPILGSEVQVLINYFYSKNMYRLFNVIGHPLTNTSFFMTFLALNHNNPKVSFFLRVSVTAIGLLLTASKAGAVLLLIYVLINMNYKDIKRTILVIIGMVLLTGTNLFRDSMYSRFESALAKGDLTNGRWMALLNTIDAGYFGSILWFPSGYGASREITNLVANSNFEMPILMWYFDYGILVTFSLVAIIVSSYFYICRNFHIREKIVYFIPVLFMFTYNGLASAGEDLFRLVIYLLILGASNDKKTVV